MSEIQFNNMKKFMKDSNLAFTDDWLTACISWIKESYPSAPITHEFLKREIFDQWLTINIQDMESKCLPSNLAQMKCTKLPGRYSLQIMSIQDIGESAYSQWNKLKKLENENTNVAATDTTEPKPAWEPKPRRCLYLTMTDGVQEVFGLEMVSIPTLSLSVKPGAKVMIMGPVDCRRGVIQLKPANVKVLGGEVEDLMTVNSVENVLSRILNKPPISTQLPVTQNNTQNDIVNRSVPTSTTSSTQQFQHQNLEDFPDDINDDFDVVGENTFEDDDIFMEIDENTIIASALATQSENRSEADTIRISQLTTQNVSSLSQSQTSTNISSQPTQTLRTSSSDSFSTNRTQETSVMPPPQASSQKQVPAGQKQTVNKVKAQFSAAKSTKSQATLSSGFKNAKTESGKQLKISGYLKPMPVVIDPPTPEREARKRFKSSERILSEESVASITTNKPSSSNVPIISMNSSSTIVARVDPIIITEEDDDSIMEIIEDSFAAELEREEQQTGSVSADHGVTSSIPIMVSSMPYIFLKQIHDNWDNLAESDDVVYVKACIATLVSKIRMDDGHWALDVCINDGSGYLNCTISSQLLDEIIGFTPQGMKQLKKAPGGKAQIANRMQNLTSTLVHWNGIFGVKIGKDPLIVSYTEIMQHHISALKERLSHLPA